jgi:nitroimidazol reductase NimA-like FMN-containing flavoprotein (pyridoxamine 5'-phosphate oxidase superfamily)
MKPNRPDLPAFAIARQGKRAAYDSETLHTILDQALVGHVGFVSEGRPMVIPMAFARDPGAESGRLYLHGASTTRIIKGFQDGAPVCLTVTLVDGIVAARSAFHHSVNYRSAVVHGSARLVTDAEEHTHALTLITEHLLPGRWNEVRPMLSKEVKATGVLALEIEAASAKVRQGPPVDDEDDYALPIWAGVVPVTTALGLPIGDGRTPGEVQPPASILKARQKFA